jgi:predicted GH43/DUF377 family glycosyl hydrolase
MRLQRFFVLIGILISLGCNAQPNEVYMFSYFTGDSRDGLKLAYSEDGYNWTALRGNQSFLKPGVGNDKLMRDPSVIRGGDGKFHMVWTVSWKERGIGYASSADLMNWSEQQFIPVMEHEPEARNTWAPEIFYDKDENLYMIYWATTIRGKFAESQVAGDDSLNHRMYYVTTSDFKTFSETKLLYDKGFNCIDAVIVKVDGKYVMFIKDETKEPVAEKNIRIATSDQLTTGWGDASEPITINWVEGPTVGKIGDAWLVYFDRYRIRKMGAVTSTDLLNWTDVSDQVSFPEGTRHGTFFTITRKEFERIKQFEDQ